MKIEVTYRFKSSQVANRFSHTLKDWHVNQVKTRLLNGGDCVKVIYQCDDSGFDFTQAQLDDLAELHGGKEV